MFPVPRELDFKWWVGKTRWGGVGGDWACPALTRGGAGAHEGLKGPSCLDAAKLEPPIPTVRQGATAFLTPQPAAAHSLGEGRELSLSLAETLGLAGRGATRV